MALEPPRSHDCDAGPRPQVDQLGSGIVYRLPVAGLSLLYGPLHALTAIVSDEAARWLQRELGEVADHAPPSDAPASDALLARLRDRLRQPPVHALPQPRTGELTTPLFLGLVPTRGCMMACGYCDFGDAHRSGGASRAGRRPAVMAIDVARAAIDAYLSLVTAAGHVQGAVHFFGGEPFLVPDFVEFAVEYARAAAAERGIRLHLEATTNGVLGRRRAEWAADVFDSLVLSLDGPPDVQDRQRPLLGGRPSFPVSSRTAAILSEGSAELVLRSCVTAASVDQLPRWAEQIAGTLRPSVVCLEPLTPSPRSAAQGHLPPEPLAFAPAFIRASRILRDVGVRTTMSTCDLDRRASSACPVGQDALVVTPDGTVTACYLPSHQWLGRGIDLHLGQVDVDAGRLVLRPGGPDGARRLSTRPKPLCARCFCRLHCAGGCHVHHDTDREPGSYDGRCLTTRLVSAAALLDRLALPSAVDAWLDDPAAASELARQPDDRLLPWGTP